MNFIIIIIIIILYLINQIIIYYYIFYLINMDFSKITYNLNIKKMKIGR